MLKENNTNPKLNISAKIFFRTEGQSVFSGEDRQNSLLRYKLTVRSAKASPSG